MQISNKGLIALASHEGIVPGPYKDSVGVLTYGIGHTKSAGDPDPAKLPKGMPNNLDEELVHILDIFKRDVEKYAATVDKAITVPISQEEFDAAVSFHYNTGAITSATWVKTLNKGDHKTAAAQIMNWSSPSEIIPRRTAEQVLFRDSVYPTSPVNAWRVDSNYKVIWTVERSISQQEGLAYLGESDKDDETSPIDDRVDFDDYRDKVQTVKDDVSQIQDDAQKLKAGVNALKRD